MIAALFLLPSLVSGLSDRKLQAVNSDSWFKNREHVILRLVEHIPNFSTPWCLAAGLPRHHACVLHCFFVPASCAFPPH